MSVFGGDSWGREAQHRKRRVDDLMLEGVDTSAYKKLSSGKFACLVCPHKPILDTPLMLSTHLKGSRHRAAEARCSDRERDMQHEINKRIALSDLKPVTSHAQTGNKSCASANKPLIERARKAVDAFQNEVLDQRKICQPQDVAINMLGNFSSQCNTVTNVEVGENDKEDTKMQSYCWERHERELKFTASGWKRDCHGKWFKDENVEFDSDEEDPNISLA